MPRLAASLDYNAICVGFRPCPPPLPLVNFIKLKRGGTAPPRKNWGGTIPPLHRSVPPSHKPQVFMRRDDPTSAQMRPASSQTTSFHGAGRSRLFTEASRIFKNHQFLWGGTIPPLHRSVPPFSQTISFFGAGPPRLCTDASRLFTNHQFLWGGTIPPLHRRVPPFHKPPIFMGRDHPASDEKHIPPFP